jgi:hypothetical protein
LSSDYVPRLVPWICQRWFPKAWAGDAGTFRRQRAGPTS